MPGDAVIYVRISRDRAGAGLGVERQEQDCRELAGRLGLTVRGVYADNDISAASGRPRPAYKAMLRDLDASPATVLCWHTDRLHRRPAELEEYVALAERHGIATHAVRAGELDLATPSGRMVARMLGATAAYEIEHMKERHQAAKKQAALAGEWRGGRRPFGYEADGKTLRPAESEALAEAAGQIIAGMPAGAVVRRWNAAGITTSTGRQWQTTELSRVLLRARNAGLIEHKGEIIGKATWDPVLTEAQWRQVRMILTSPARRTSPGPQRRWLLSGILTCGVCDAKMMASTTAGKDRGTRPVYRCRKGGGIVHVARDCKSLDEFVTGYVLNRIGERDRAGTLLVAPPDMKLLDAELAAIESQLEDLAEQGRKRTASAGFLASIAGPLEADAERLRDRRAALTRPTALSPFAGKDPRKVWEDETDLDEQRAVVAALVTVKVNRSPRGRPAGWKAGQPYFDARSVEIDPI